MSRIKRTNTTERVAIIGKIKIGEKSEKGFPVSLDHFKADGKYAHLFHEAFGEKPDNIEIVFISDDEQYSCNERLEIRQGTKLYAFGDGEIISAWDKDSEKYIEHDTGKEPDLMADIAKKLNAEWKEVLTLRFIIPRIKSVFGVWELSTQGEASSIPALVGTIDKVRAMAGTISRIPFDLSIKKVKSQKPDSKSNFPVLSLVANMSSGHLDLVKSYIQAGIEFNGLITEDKIDAIEVKQIEAPVGQSMTVLIADQISDTPPIPTVVAEAEPSPIQPGKITYATKVISECKTKDEIIAAANKLNEEYTWDASKKKIVKSICETRLKEIAK